MTKERVNNRNKYIKCTDPKCQAKNNSKMNHGLHIWSDTFKTRAHKHCTSYKLCDCGKPTCQKLDIVSQKIEKDTFTDKIQIFEMKEEFNDAPE